MHKVIFEVNFINFCLQFTKLKTLIRFSDATANTIAMTSATKQTATSPAMIRRSNATIKSNASTKTSCATASPTAATTPTKRTAAAPRTTSSAAAASRSAFQTTGFVTESSIAPTKATSTTRGV